MEPAGAEESLVLVASSQDFEQLLQVGWRVARPGIGEELMEPFGLVGASRKRLAWQRLTHPWLTAIGRPQWLELVLRREPRPRQFVAGLLWLMLVLPPLEAVLLLEPVDWPLLVQQLGQRSQTLMQRPFLVPTQPIAWHRWPLPASGYLGPSEPRPAAFESHQLGPAPAPRLAARQPFTVGPWPLPSAGWRRVLRVVPATAIVVARRRRWQRFGSWRGGSASLASSSPVGP